MLTVVVPFYNGHKHIDRLLDSLPQDVPVIIVDDQSDEPLQLNRKGVQVFRPDKKGYFTGAVNYGAERCKTDFLILNQDTYFEGERWLSLLRGNYAAIGEGIRGRHPAWPRGYIHGTFMFIRRNAWETVGPMNEIDYPLWGSTCEWQLRACRKGYRILPLAEIPGFHHKRKGNFGDSIASLLKKEPQNKDKLIRTPPMISVVISTYNYGRYLPDAIASLVGGPSSMGMMPGQTFQSFEVIIVDDASIDTTEEIGKSLADPWKGIRYIRREKTGGTPAANNTGISKSYGKVISMLCADDMMHSERLEKMLRLLERNPHSMIYDDIHCFANGDWTKIQITRGERSEFMRMLEPYDFERLLEKNQIHSGIMFPKQAWKDVGGYSEEMRWGREDWQMNVALGMNGYCGVHLREPFYWYRREQQNRSIRNTSKSHRRDFLSQMQKVFPSLYRGIRMAGCCGSRKARRAKSTPAAAKAASKKLVGANGMTLLEYMGTNAGTNMWWCNAGGVNARYEFGGKKKFGYVDNGHVKEMLAKNEPDGKAAFRVSKKRKPAPVQAVEFVPAVKEEEVDIDPFELSVAKLKEAIEGVSPDALTGVLEKELAGKNRVSAVKVLQNAIMG